MSEHKQCTICRKWLLRELFARNIAAKDGLRTACRACTKEKRVLKERTHGMRTKKEFRIPYNANGDKWCKRCKCWLSPTLFSYSRTKWDRRQAYCRACHRQWSKGYRNDIPNAVKAAQMRKCRANNINLRLAGNLRSRINSALLGICKSVHMIELLGCPIEQFRQHLETKFQSGMTWNNHGLKGWHVGHIQDCCSFDLTDKTQQRKCFHFSNLEPQWCTDNWRKPHQRIQKNTVHSAA